ncbi:alpha/beta hydrolase [Paenibacillus qinlingensis]|uniref:Acetyl esterase/lipase n=1 Tax=Paenibacillus qinlingensis TaxID=1837343 RepID=A0ABU1NT23_9BACL|nr:alpha/beta hydrolase [Paenibacillus qinlingensis]MDR6550583.1 acetyl esterase/lipase [Paenibacillus qinlingensis]
MPVHYDVSYCNELPETRVLDLFLPDGIKNGAAILFIHGGGWAKGDKQQFRDVAAWFAERGFVCASMKYRLSTEKPYPAALEDARLAMQYMRVHADELGFSPTKIASAGSSAGGYLAAMLALIQPDDELGRTAELVMTDTRANAVALYCPVTTLHVDKEFVLKFMAVPELEAPERYREGSPIDRISGGEPSFLILNGDEDNTTPLAEVRAFAEKLLEAGSRAEVIALPGVKHGFSYGITSDAQQRSIQSILAFLQDEFELG